MLNKYIHQLLCKWKAIKLCCCHGCGFVTDVALEKINGFAGRTGTTQLDDTCHCDMQRTAACGFLFYFRSKRTHGAKKLRAKTKKRICQFPWQRIHRKIRVAGNREMDSYGNRDAP